MHFCTNCGNMYYIRLSGTPGAEDEAAVAQAANELKYYCRNCGHVDETLTVDNITVVDTKTATGGSFTHAVNRYTVLDPTLPHISTIKCPNAICDSNEDETKRDVVYIRYDDVAMKYIYICTVCDTIWKTNEE